MALSLLRSIRFGPTISHGDSAAEVVGETIQTASMDVRNRCLAGAKPDRMDFPIGLTATPGPMVTRAHMGIRVRMAIPEPTVILAHTVRSEEHTSELQSHSFISYAVFCLT